MVPLATRLLLLALAAAPPLQAAAPPLPAPSTADAPGARLLDRIVAVIDGQPLLLSEIEFETRIALISRGGRQAAWAPLADDDLAAGLEYVIGQRLAHAEADRLQVFAVADEEVAAALREFAAKFPNDKLFRQFFLLNEASEEQLAAVVRRNLRVARYVDSKVKLAARVSEDELKRHFRDHAADFEGRSYPDVRDGIKALLTRERYQTLAAKQFGELRSRADVRLLAPFARPTARLAGEPPSGAAPDAGGPSH